MTINNAPEWVRKDLHDDAMLLHEASIAELEAERDALQAKLDRAIAYIEVQVGSQVYTSVDAFAKPHESEASRQARFLIAELKGTNHDT